MRSLAFKCSPVRVQLRVLNVVPAKPANERDIEQHLSRRVQGGAN